jgi:hypothetical protein
MPTRWLSAKRSRASSSDSTSMRVAQSGRVPKIALLALSFVLMLVLGLVLERLSDPIQSVLDGGNDHELKFILTFEASFCENAPENSFAPLSFVLVLPMNTRSMSLAINVL